MNSLWLLMGLMGLVFLGSFLVEGHVIKGFGLPSSIEYVVLGFVLGPYALGVLGRETIVQFEAFVQAAIGWIALTIGINYGYVGTRRIVRKHLVIGITTTLFAACLLAFLAFFILKQTTSLHGKHLYLASMGLGAALCKTTRHSVRWALHRYQAQGPLSNFLADTSDASEAIPLLLTGCLFAAFPTQTTITLHAVSWIALTTTFGVVLGLVATVLLGQEFRLDESWGVLLGMSTMCIGLTVRAGQSPMLSMFAMGLTLAGTTQLRREIDAMVAPTERSVLLPLMLLAGARLDFSSIPHVGWLIGSIVAGRIVTQLFVGFFFSRAVRVARSGGSFLGIGLLASGGVSMCVGVSFSLRHPGTMGDLVLSISAIVIAIGEWFGPAGLRASLERAGELNRNVSQQGSEVIHG